MAKKTPETEIKQKIYLSARKLFVEKGYHQTSIPDIVKDAGVSIGAIYHHFSSKEELARVIHEDAVESFLSRYQLQVEAKATAKEKIRGFVEMMFNWADEDLITVNYLLHARPKEILDCNFTICTAEGLEAVKKIVEFGQKEGTFKDADQILLAAFISGPVMRLIELKTDGIITQPLSSIIDTTAQLIFDALKK
ncbi:TetR family transcriptional regulator [Carboxydothermus islandicus]|uniref:TetR family transcriptional regulator n=1 Tax=Carboxydothermus islandicus TaxID=661089 RepID=A0A1L8D3R2_9THEO|nr:TetR/AcrR family transcriptional regulator [Carboxydothermus islandicus]GAV25711.1 TetR family transcriptional regulator [Carboxydothermus islandicus]